MSLSNPPPRVDRLHAKRAVKGWTVLGFEGVVRDFVLAEWHTILLLEERKPFTKFIARFFRSYFGKKVDFKNKRRASGFIARTVPLSSGPESSSSS
jgi:hypothetical protein